MLFPDISNLLFLSFLDSRIVQHKKTKELLNGKDDFLDWMDHLSQKNASYKAAAKILKSEAQKDYSHEAVLQFREELFQLLSAFLTTQDQDLLGKKIENLINQSALELKLIDEQPLLLPKEGGLLKSLQVLVWMDVIAAISRGELKKLRHCSNPDCVLLFIDKSGRRKWCSMQICGNRNKVKRFKNKEA